MECKAGYRDVVETRRERVFTITLSEDEARVVMTVCSNVGGPVGGKRNVTEAVYDFLCENGIESYDQKETFEPSRNGKIGLYFKDGQ